ncbi:WD40-repeat-containing domain protein [Suillus ampliporus]|nr:WD40-repeat-containing domain protein [Suillus ampliporus]
MAQLIRSSTPVRAFEDHEAPVNAVAVFPDRRRMVTGSQDKTLRLWDLKTGVVLKKLEVHCDLVMALEVSRDGQSIASGGDSGEITIWHEENGESLGARAMKAHSSAIFSLDFSPDGTVLATAPRKSNQTAVSKSIIQGTRHCVAHLDSSYCRSLAWTPNGTRLLSTGHGSGSTIREWDVSTWEQVGHLWKGHTDLINAITIDPTGTLITSASNDNDVRLWRLSDRRTIAIFPHSQWVHCVTFSIDGKHILSGGGDKKISEWEVPRDVFLAGLPEVQVSKMPTTTPPMPVALLFWRDNSTGTVRFMMQSVSIRPSLAGYMSKGIALCGKQQFWDATKAFDVVLTFTDGDSKIFLFLIKANQHEEAIMRVQELAATPHADTLACHIVEAYLRVQLGTIALDSARHKEAANHFTAAVNASASFSKSAIHSKYEEFTVLFGWDLKSLWQTANKQRCVALFRAGQVGAALESYRYMMDMSDEPTKAIFFSFFTGKSSVMSPELQSSLVFPSALNEE